MKAIRNFGRYNSIPSILGWIALMMFISTCIIEVKWLEYTITGIAFLIVIIAIWFEEVRK